MLMIIPEEIDEYEEMAMIFGCIAAGTRLVHSLLPFFLFLIGLLPT